MLREDPHERLAFFQPAALPGTEVMAVYGSMQPWHMFHERYAFGACSAGAAGVRYRGREDLVHGGSVLVREPGETHCNTFISEPADFKTLFIDAQVLSQAVREMAGAAAVHFAPGPITRDARLFAALGEFCSSVESGTDDLEQQCLFVTAIARLARHAEAPLGGPELHGRSLAVERAKSHLQERFHESVRLDELAAVARVSRFHLVHAFTRETGLPPHAYQMHVRVERARRLLQGGMPTAGVAASVGFADQSHLTRWFKRILRVTPSAYARDSRYGRSSLKSRRSSSSTVDSISTVSLSTGTTLKCPWG